jgi:hypothetical protein
MSLEMGSIDSEHHESGSVNVIKTYRTRQRHTDG